jgi:HEAT repeat protein
VFNRVKSVFFVPDPPVIGPEVQVDAAAKDVLATAMQKDFSDEVREDAARALGILKAKDQAPLLIMAFEDPQNREHPGVRVQIAHALGVIRDPAAGPAFEKALQDSDPKVVQEAILGIGLVGYSPARAALEQVFRTDSNRNMKSRALEALSLMRDKGNTPLFESLLNDKNDSFRELSAEGLARLEYNANGWKQVYEQERKPTVRNALAFGLAASGDTDYMAELANGFNTRQAYQVEVYLYELGKYDGKLGDLYRYLKSSDPKVRAGVARVIGNIGDPASTEQIRPLRDDPNAEVVNEAVNALRKLIR